MRFLFVLALVSISAIATFAQELPKKEGTVEIRIIYRHVIKQTRFSRHKKFYNKQHRPKEVIYLDTLGNPIEHIKYGKHHNADLRVLDYVIISKYEKDRIVEEVKYCTDYHENISLRHKTRFEYNNKNQLITERELYYPDSSYSQIDYEYDSVGNRIKTLTPPVCYCRTFDKDSRLTSKQQYYRDTLQWQYQYIYTDSTRVGYFTTYYTHGKNYNRQETNLYANGYLIQTKDEYIQDGYSRIKKISYSRSGLIQKIGSYTLSSTNNILEPEYYIDFKIKTRQILDRRAIKKTNELLIWNASIDD